MAIQERKSRRRPKSGRAEVPSHVKHTQRQLIQMKDIIGNLLSPFATKIKFLEKKQQKRK